MHVFLALVPLSSMLHSDSDLLRFIRCFSDMTAFLYIIFLRQWKFIQLQLSRLILLVLPAQEAPLATDSDASSQTHVEVIVLK